MPCQSTGESEKTRARSCFSSLGPRFPRYWMYKGAQKTPIMNLGATGERLCSNTEMVSDTVRALVDYMRASSVYTVFQLASDDQNG